MSVLIVPTVPCPRSPFSAFQGLGSSRVLAAASCFALAMLGMFVSTAAMAQDQPAETQDAAAAQPAAKAAEDPFLSALDLIPQSAAGLVRIPNLPDVCDAGPKTHIGMLLEEPELQPFIDAQRDRAEKYIKSMETSLGLRPQDLYDIASGEVVAAWLPFEKDQRRPFALCVIADIRGRKGLAETALETIDADLKAGGATRVDAKHRNQTVRVYNTKPKPGQLKIEQVAITLSDERIIAADRDSVVLDLLDAIAGSPRGDSIGTVADFQMVMKQSRDALAGTKNDAATDAVEWFARPFPMARILRKSMGVDRGTDIDILKLLENQGFDAVKAAGGVAVIAGDKFDVLHRGVVLAPATAPMPDRYAKAAKMLQLDNSPLAAVPAWVPEDAASFTRLHWNIERGFWAAEPLVNEALDDDIFRSMIDGIRDDEEGPQIDIAKNVLPNLDDQILLVTDNTLPASPTSERMLVAVRIRDAKAIAEAVRKAMEVEPDASKIDGIPGIDMWRVQRGGGSDDFDDEFLNDLGFDDDAKQDAAPPLLDHWAIAVVDQGPSSDAAYLMFSSHPELLQKVAERIRGERSPGFADQANVQEVSEGMKSLGAESVAIDRLVRTDLSLRVKYELLRQGRLEESDSVLSTLVRRIFEKQEGDVPEKLDAAMLPPIDQIKQHLRPGGGYIEMTDTGMSINGFLLK